MKRDRRYQSLALALLVSVVVGVDAQVRTPESAARIISSTPVTDAMLEHPDPADWLHWRRTLDSWGFSPLTQINKDTGKRLQIAWSHELGQGVVQPTPLVHDGVMYVPQPPGVVQALDAATGVLIWEYRKTFEASPSYSWTARTRTIAIYQDKLP
jgi:glucose dehydrogenase